MPLNDLQSLLIQSFYINTSWLFSSFLNDNIVDIEKADWMCLLTFIVDEYLELFLHPSIFLIIDSRLIPSRLCLLMKTKFLLFSFGFMV